VSYLNFPIVDFLKYELLFIVNFCSFSFVLIFILRKYRMKFDDICESCLNILIPITSISNFLVFIKINPEGFFMHILLVAVVALFDVLVVFQYEKTTKTNRRVCSLSKKRGVFLLILLPLIFILWQTMFIGGLIEKYVVNA